jgi:hypothetical protein
MVSSKRPGRPTAPVLVSASASSKAAKAGPTPAERVEVPYVEPFAPLAPRPLSRALELPVLRLQIRDKDGHIQQVTVNSTLALGHFPLTPVMKHKILESVRLFWSAFGGTVEMVEFLTHQSWEL